MLAAPWRAKVKGTAMGKSILLASYRARRPNKRYCLGSISGPLMPGINLFTGSALRLSHGRSRQPDHHDRKEIVESTTFGRLPLIALGAGLLFAAVLLALSKPAQSAGRLPPG